MNGTIHFQAVTVKNEFLLDKYDNVSFLIHNKNNRNVTNRLVKRVGMGEAVLSLSSKHCNVSQDTAIFSIKFLRFSQQTHVLKINTRGIQ